MLLLKGSGEHKPQIVCASHLWRFLQPQELKIMTRVAVSVLSKHDFDAVAFRGISGNLIAPAIAMEMNKSLIAVRKTTKDCHSDRRVEGDIAARRYVIVDDFICSGATVNAIMDEIYEVNKEGRCIGVLEAMCLSEHNETYKCLSIYEVNSWLKEKKLLWEKPEFILGRMKLRNTYEAIRAQNFETHSDAVLDDLAKTL